MSFVNMSVTFDRASDEYGGDIEDIQLPIRGAAMPDPQPATVTGAQLLERARTYKGRYFDRDAPQLAQMVAAAFPDMSMGSYAALAGPSTAWCGIFAAKVLAEFGIRPPFGTDDLHRWMWVDAWLDFGTPIPNGQEQSGDLALWLGSPHHISFVAGNGKYCGGNQGDAVTETSFRKPDAIRRAPAVAGAPPIDTNDPAALPLLTLGDTGAFVEKLQQRLGVEVDGEFGPNTEAAVRQYQEAHGLLVDGEVGPQTWASLLGKAPPVVSDDPPKYVQYRQEYAANWQQMVINPSRAAAVDQIARKLLANKARYQAVERTTGVPWYVIAVLHERESSADFTTHLHNGDPLSARTFHVPAGRPPGQPPFTWEQSAIDALTLDGLTKVSNWTIERIAYQCELYNGWGYRTHGVPSAYLWSFSNIYRGGKYVADGVWSSTAQDQQCGVMPIIKQLAALDRSIVIRSYLDQPLEPDLPDPEVPMPTDPTVPAPLPTPQPRQIDWARIERLAETVERGAAALDRLAEQMQGKPSSGPAGPAAPTTTPAPAAQPGILSLLGPALARVLPMLGVQGGIWGTVASLVLGGLGMLGNMPPVGGTPVSGTVIPIAAGGIMSGLASLIGRLLKPPTKTT